MITSFPLFENKFSRYMQALSPKTTIDSRFIFSKSAKTLNFCPSKISSYAVFMDVNMLTLGSCSSIYSYMYKDELLVMYLSMLSPSYPFQYGEGGYIVGI